MNPLLIPLLTCHKLLNNTFSHWTNTYPNWSPWTEPLTVCKQMKSVTLVWYFHMTTPVTVKQPWRILANPPHESTENDDITTTKQSTMQPCGYNMGYTVACMKNSWSITGRIYVWFSNIHLHYRRLWYSTKSVIEMQNNITLPCIFIFILILVFKVNKVKRYMTQMVFVLMII